MELIDEVDDCVQQKAHVDRKNSHVQASDHVSVTVVQRRPRAIVVLLGWMGAEVGQLKDYARLYHNLLCCTVVATAPMFAIASHNTAVLGEVATAACREAARLVRMAEMSEMGYGTVPLLLHVFGNGGALVLEQMDRLIRGWVPQQDLEDVQHQTLVSSCPLPLRTLTLTGSMKSLPSVTSTTNDSEEEDDIDDSPSTKDLLLLTPPPRLRTASSSSTFSISPKRLGLSFDQCRIQALKTTPVPLRSLKVRRIDLERSAAFPPVASTPKYNKDARAYRLDFSTVASRLFLGSILFDSCPTYPTLSTDVASTEHISNPIKRMIVWSALVARRAIPKLPFSSSSEELYSITVGEKMVQGRPAQFWKNMEHLKLTKQLVYVYRSTRTNDVLKELINVQKEKGMNVRELFVEVTEGNDRLSAYSGLVEGVMDSVAKKMPHDDDEDEGFDSDDEDWKDARDEDEWYDAREEESCNCDS